ncbi:hypothetical protein Bca101_082575 [Brassica carinata]
MMSFWKERSSGDDHSAGDTLCSECSLVLESHSIDKTSEWRTFANESSNSDPNRVGGPTNPLLADSAFTTVIAKTNGSSGDFLSNSLGRWQNRNGSAELGLIQAFKTIATMSDRLGLVGTIKDRANEIFKRLEDQKSTRGRNQDVLWQPACTFPVDKRTSHELLRKVLSDASCSKVAAGEYSGLRWSREPEVEEAINGISKLLVSQSINLQSGSQNETIHEYL